MGECHSLTHTEGCSLRLHRLWTPTRGLHKCKPKGQSLSPRAHASHKDRYPALSPIPVSLDTWLLSSLSPVYSIRCNSSMARRGAQLQIKWALCEKTMPTYLSRNRNECSPREQCPDGAPQNLQSPWMLAGASQENLNANTHEVSAFALGEIPVHLLQESQCYLCRAGNKAYPIHT